MKDLMDAKNTKAAATILAQCIKDLKEIKAEQSELDNFNAVKQSILQQYKREFQAALQAGKDTSEYLALVINLELQEDIYPLYVKLIFDPIKSTNNQIITDMETKATWATAESIFPKLKKIYATSATIISEAMPKVIKYFGDNHGAKLKKEYEDYIEAMNKNVYQICIKQYELNAQKKKPYDSVDDNSYFNKINGICEDISNILGLVKENSFTLDYTNHYITLETLLMVSALLETRCRQSADCRKG